MLNEIHIKNEANMLSHLSVYVSPSIVPAAEAPLNQKQEHHLTYSHVLNPEMLMKFSNSSRTAWIEKKSWRTLTLWCEIKSYRRGIKPNHLGALIPPVKSYMLVTSMLQMVKMKQRLTGTVSGSCSVLKLFFLCVSIHLLLLLLLVVVLWLLWIERIMEIMMSWSDELWGRFQDWLWILFLLIVQNESSKMWGLRIPKLIKCEVNCVYILLLKFLLFYFNLLWVF